MLSCCFSNLLVRQFNLGKSLNYTYVSVNVIIIQVRTGNDSHEFDRNVQIVFVLGTQ